MNTLATLAGGCFWCTEAVFQEVKGVDSIVSGYCGGTTENPSYNQVHYDDTGHAESIQMTFDPNVISYEDILKIFYYIHDPTTLNQDGANYGTEYRSAIFYHDEEQKKIAEDVTQNFAPTIWDNPIVTEITPYTKFWPAEPEHQNFFLTHPEQAYCRVIINPKLEKFRKKFVSLLK
jgi:peptide-methionine (S)-S-oxide reductase